VDRVTDLGAPSRAAFIPHWCKGNFGELCAFAYPIEKKHGMVSITKRPAMEITGIKCSEIPKG
jgi:hypothetical protein